MSQPTSLREQILNNAKATFQSKRVKVAGVEVEVRTPTVAQSAALSALSESGDAGKRLTTIAIQSALDPATGKPIFVPEDEAALLELPLAELSPLVEAFMALVTEARNAPKS